MPKTQSSPEYVQNFILFPLWILAVTALGNVMHSADNIFLWLISSFFLFAILDPGTLWLKQRGWRTPLASLALMALAVFVFITITLILARFSANILMELEESKRTFIQYYQSIRNSLKSVSTGISQSVGNNAAAGGAAAADRAVQKVEVVQNSPLGGELGSTLMHGLGSAVTGLTFGLLWPILTFFFMLERDSMAKIIPLIFRDPKKGSVIWQKIVAATRAFFLGNLVLAVVTYPIFVALFFLFSVRSVFTLAALASFFNLVPFLGALLSGFLPSLALLSQNEGFGPSLGLYGCCILVHFVVANFVTPKVLGSKVDINATTSTIALIVWGEMWGGIGLLLAIPITSTLKILMENSDHPRLRWMAALMSEDVSKCLSDLKENF